MKPIQKELLKGTKLVYEFFEGRISFENFVKSYANFYHFNALDGHEEKLDDSYSKVIIFHENIQAIVDQIYWGENKNGGRITPNEGEKKLRHYLRENDIKNILTIIS